jgi:hypothetical protein
LKAREKDTIDEMHMIPITQHTMSYIHTSGIYRSLGSAFWVGVEIEGETTTLYILKALGLAHNRLHSMAWSLSLKKERCKYGCCYGQIEKGDELKEIREFSNNLDFAVSEWGNNSVHMAGKSPFCSLFKELGVWLTVLTSPNCLPWDL